MQYQPVYGINNAGKCWIFSNGCVLGLEAC